MTELTQDRLKESLSYDPDTGLFTWIKKPSKKIKVGSTAGCKHPNGYIRIQIDYKLYGAHQLAWLYVYGESPACDIDHVDELKDNNRIVNLRLDVNRENPHNVSKPRSDNTSGYRGVDWREDLKKWQARIMVNGKSKHLGYFNTAVEAYAAYLCAKRKLHPFWEEKKL
jgi:hypothetical protein